MAPSRTSTSCRDIWLNHKFDLMAYFSLDGRMLTSPLMCWPGVDSTFTIQKCGIYHRCDADYLYCKKGKKSVFKFLPVNKLLHMCPIQKQSDTLHRRWMITILSWRPSVAVTRADVQSPRIHHLHCGASTYHVVTHLAGLSAVLFSINMIT